MLGALGPITLITQRRKGGIITLSHNPPENYTGERIIMSHEAGETKEIVALLGDVGPSWFPIVSSSMPPVSQRLQYTTYFFFSSFAKRDPTSICVAPSRIDFLQ